VGGSKEARVVEGEMNSDGGRGIGTDDVLWKVSDVALYLKVSRSWVYHRAEEGTLPSLRIGGLLRFEPSAIREFARGGTSASESIPHVAKVAG
jgi:excisionase family DNA binding protein